MIVVSPLRGLATVIRMKYKSVKPIDKIFATDEGRTQEFGFHSDLLWERRLVI